VRQYAPFVIFRVFCFFNPFLFYIPTNGATFPMDKFPF